MLNNEFLNLPDNSKPDRKHALYFAYGSNLNLDQMGRRCPAASPLATVTLKDYKLLFCGSNRAGVATVEPCKGSNVIGGLWLITSDCLRALDIYEGFPRLYERVALDVVDDAGLVYNAITYYMVGEPPLSLPSRYYFDVIREGYDDFNLSESALYETVRNQYEQMLRPLKFG
jgi:gamma-glutamylcyclotransferase (GGCT)/AIG2-like uncharacterized protein YtfP